MVVASAPNPPPVELDRISKSLGTVSVPAAETEKKLDVGLPLKM